MIEKMMASNSFSSTKKAPRAAAAAAITGMLTLNKFPAEAFTPSFLVPSSRMMHRSPSFPSTLFAPAEVTMDCSPWDIRQTRQRRPGPMIFATPEDLFHGPAVQPQQPFAISDPTVTQDTDDLYTLTFDLPAGVDHDGLEVSVSGRLLTVKARVTREEDTGPSASRGGWVTTRSSRTYSASRSFVLPEGLSASSAAASLLSDGKAEVKLTKDQAVSGVADTEAAPPEPDSTLPVNEASAAPAPSAETSTSSSAATAAVAGEPATAGEPAPAGGDAPTASSTVAAPPASDAERPASLPESPFDVLDHEFREFARAMWGEEVAEKAAAAKEAWAKREAQFAERSKAAEEARVQREADFAERVKAAKDARARRVLAMRRATMASDVSKAEDGSSYIVRVALPEGVIRDNVKLTANPNSTLRVTVSTNVQEGGRSVYKDVFLPKDALLGDISARFEAEHHDEKESDHKDDVEGAAAASNLAGADAVSGLEVIVGRAVPPQPKDIDIM